MIAIWIGTFFFLQAVVLVFALMLCKSAALADREFERARAGDQRTWSNGPERIEREKELMYPQAQSLHIVSDTPVHIPNR